MLTNYVKRMLSFALALIMVLGMLPMQVFATDGHDHAHEGETCELVEQLREMIAEGVRMCGANADMTDDELLDAFFALDDDQIEAILADYETGFALAEELSEEEAVLLGQEENTKLAKRLYYLMENLGDAAVYAAGDTYTLTEGVTAVVSGSSAEGFDGTTLSVTAKGTTTGSGCDAKHAKGTSTITITNNKDDKVFLSFGWEVATGTVVFGDVTGVGSAGTHSLILESKASLAITLTTEAEGSDAEATIKLADFSASGVADAANVTVFYDSSFGSVSVNGTNLTSGETVEVSTDAETSIVATASGSIFLGWVNENDVIVSTDAQYNVRVAVDTTIKAVFAKDGGEAVFALGTTAKKTQSDGDFVYHTVNRTHLIVGLDKAIAAAQAGSSKTVVLMNNGTITGNYTIPSGVTLLIPCDDAGTLSTTQPRCMGETDSGGGLTATATGSIYPYKTLTMASGSSITIANGGAMNVNAVLFAIGGSEVGGGSPLGGHGYVKMQENSAITVENGGAMYTYGYINGVGTVTVKNGGKVYEVFQYEDFRGGSKTTSVISNSDKYHVFPLSDYYVQNIMVPLTLEAGAVEGSYASLYMSNATYGSAVEFISSSNAMFNLKSGSVTKRYDHARDRLVFDVNGEVEIAGISMSIASFKMNSSDFVLPINSNITININSGSISVQQGVALLPGAEVNIKNGADCTLVAGGALYLYDNENWGPYVGPNAKTFIPAHYVPERQHTMTAAELKDAQIIVEGSVTAAGSVYTTSGGAAIIGTEGAVVRMTPSATGKTYQFDQNNYHEFSCDNGKLAPAMLRNADGTYYKSSDTPKDADGNYITGYYLYKDGQWRYVCKDNIHTEGPDATCGDPKVCTVCGLVIAEATGDHNWLDANCDTPSTCSVCGQTIGQPLGHEFVTKPAKPDVCEDGKTGYKESQYCDVCQQYYDAEGTLIGDEAAWEAWKLDPEGGLIDNVAHTWAEQSVTNPTCTENGYTVYYCTVCYTKGITATKQEPIEALGHIGVKGKDCKAATCEVNGIADYYFCDQCDKYFTTMVSEKELTGEIGDANALAIWKTTEGNDGGLIPAVGHDYQTTVTLAPTCTEKGSQTTACANGCGINTTVTEIPTAGHKPEAVKAVPATCTDDGVLLHYVCTSCSQKSWDEKGLVPFQTGDTEVDPAKGHTWANVTTNWVQKDDGWYCEASATCGRNCGETLSEVKKGEVDTDPAKTYAATCEKDGKTTYTVTFENSTVFTAQPKEVTTPKTNHVYKVTYAWEGAGASWVCNATAVCQNENCPEKTKTASAVGVKDEENSSAPDCLNAGENVFKATFVDANIFAGDTYKVEVPAAGHSFDKHEEKKDATCTEDGNEAYWHCSVCDKNYGDEGKYSTNEIENIVIAATGHKELTAYEEKSATCLEAGYEAYWQCKCGVLFCDEGITSIDKIVVIPAAGHQFGEMVKANAETCTEDGNMAYYTCSVCEKNYADNNSMTTAELASVIISATGHVFGELVEGYAATCLENGRVAHYVCEKCDNYYADNDQMTTNQVETITILAVGHSFGEQVAAKAATCTDAGNVGYYPCAACGLNYSDGEKFSNKTIEDVVIPATGHSYEINPGQEWIVDTDATCLTDGSKHRECTNPDCDAEETKVIPATGHAFGEEVAAKDATCIENGNVAYYTCGNCGKHFADDAKDTEQEIADVEIKAEGHKLTHVPAVAPDCTNNGNIEHWNCSVCHNNYIDNDSYAAVALVKVVLDALKHQIVEVPYEPATCEASGVYGHYKCVRTDCGKLFKDANGNEAFVGETVIPVRKHDIEEVANSGKAATCLEAGWKAHYACTYSDCGKLFADVGGTEIADLDTWRSEGNNGWIQPAGHQNITPVAAKAANCEVSGTKAYWTCGVCHVNYADAECTEANKIGDTAALNAWLTTGEGFIASTGHAWGEGIVTKDPTCYDDGIRTFTCANANCPVGTKTEPEETQGHHGTVVSGQEATCLVDGWNDYYYCAGCDTNYEDAACTIKINTNIGSWKIGNGRIPATDHDWEADADVYTAPTCVTAGSQGYVCKNDAAHTKTETIDALGHENVTATEKQDATCDTDGHQAYWTCGVCQISYFAVSMSESVKIGDAEALNQWLTEGNGKIEKLNHPNVEQVAAVAPDCTTAGVKEHYKCTECDAYFSDDNKTLIENIDAWKAEGGEGYLAPEHDLVEAGGKPATCTTTGKMFVYCNKCDYEGSIVVDALGHDMQPVAVQAPTCTEPGVASGTLKCSRCDYTETSDDGEDLSALGHIYTLVKNSGKAATCLDDGWNAHYECTREGCGMLFDDDHGNVIEDLDAWRADAGKIPAIDHKNANKINGVAADCVNEGTMPYWYCKDCGKYFSDEACDNAIDDLDAWKDGDGKIAALGHDQITPTAAKDPTCTATGTKAYWTCGVCGISYSDAECTEANKIGNATKLAQWLTTEGQGLVAAKGHDLDDGVVTTDPTCTAPGKKTYTCMTGCGYEEYEEISATGHTEKDLPAVEATCTATGLTAGKQCTKCNTITVPQSVVVKKQHVGVPQDGKDATCEETGYKAYYMCSGCGIFYETEDCSEAGKIGDIAALEAWQTTGKGVKPAINHDWEIDTNVYTAPTCTEAGSQGYVCKNDPNHTKTESVKATGHSKQLNYVAGQAADCENAGWKGYYCCTNAGCDALFADVTGNTPITLAEWKAGAGKIPANGHTYELVVGSAKAATCIEDGWKAHYHCTTSGCSKIFDAIDGNEIANLDAWRKGEGKIPAAGHNLTHHEAVASDCTNAGTIEYWSCSVCNKNFGADDQFAAVALDSVVDAADGHVLTHHAAVDAECITDGNIEYWHCATCDKNFATDDQFAVEALDKVVVEAAGHNLTHHEAVASDCTNAGTIEYWSCSVCNKNFGANDQFAAEALDSIVDAADGHNLTHYAAVDADCITDGNVEYWSCSACGKNFATDNQFAVEALDKEVVEATGHTLTHHAAVASTCTADGNIEYWSCSVCNKNFGADDKFAAEALDSIVDAADGHNLTHQAAVAAECEVDGNHEYWYCSVCHVYFKNAEATQTYENDSHIIPAPGHTVKVIPGVAPTCTNVGKTESKECSVCGKTLVGFTFIDAKGHTAGEPTRENEVAPKCIEAGSYDEVVKCADCGTELSRQTKYTPGTGHVTLTAVEQKDPDCENAGHEAYWECSCGKLFSDAEAKEPITEPVTIPKTGHTKVVDEAKDPDCENTGLTAGEHCSVCGKTLKAQLEVPAKGHTKTTDPYKAPTCTATGLTEGSHCTVCNKTLDAQKEIPATGHDEVDDLAKDPDCENTGLTAGKHCSVCGEILKAQEEIKALGHTEVILDMKAPTCTEKGLTDGKYCSVCGKTLKKQDEIPATGHDEVIDKAVAPTCTTTGLSEGKHCSVCGETLKAQEVVPAKGHISSPVKGAAAKCEQAGWKDCYQCETCKKYFADAACTQPIEDLTAWRTTGDGVIPGLEHQWNNGIVTTLPLCDVDGVKTYTCGVCYTTKTGPEPMLGHIPEYHEAQHPTYYSVGWEAYETCKRVDCEYNTMVGIPALGEPSVNTYEDFMSSLKMLEGYANDYAKANPGKDPMWLLIKYVRTGVDRYNSGSWNIMAGYEDEGFAEYVKAQEEAYNKAVPTVEEMINVTGIKNIGGFDLPNGQEVDFGHMFGTMDITYHNKTSINHADVSGWAGDLVDLLSTADRHDVTGTVDAMIKEIGDTYLNHSIPGESDQFSRTDMYGDLDGYYFMNEIIGKDYENGMLYGLMEDYFVASLTDEQRADYFLKNRLGGVTGRNEIREAVFNEYTGNDVIATLEGTREFKQSDISDLRKACCYAFADYLCYLAGDYVELGDNPYFTVNSTELSTLAPGITQQITKATTADGKNVVYYTATADVNSPYVNVYANYKDNDPSKGWGMQRVLDQANAAQARYGDPESEQYIENFNVIAAINGSGYNMTTGEPSGVLMMGGVEYHKPSGGFVGFLYDGSCYIGTDAEYNALKEQGLIRDAISMFGTTLVKDGKIAVNASGAYFNDRASRTAIGITRTGKVVFMVMDGRQEPTSCGGSAVEIAQVMLEAGCVHAINLDGGGSTTYVARQEGEDELSVVNKPSDGFPRSVSTSLYVASTAPSSTAFDHAVLDSEYRHMTIGASVQVTATGVSATGNPTELPEGITWVVSDATVASITEDGLVTGLANGQVEVRLMNGENVVGTRTLNVVVPDAVYFTKENMNAIYGVKTPLPVAALFEGKPVAILERDAGFTLSHPTAGTTEGFTFTGIEESGIKSVKIFAYAVNNPDATKGSMGINMFRADEASFDFDNINGGDRLLAYNRVVSNSTTADGVTYTIVDHDKPMVTEYTFGMDMTQIPIPEQLSSLVYMLPGADVEGNNSAWDFLLQLAERVSVLTEVRATLKLDPRFDVDYSDLTVNCEYFILDQTEYDPETNKLTLVLHWKDQTKAIDPNTANPLVILAGIKLTPKADADWGEKDRITALNSGEISYDIYLRANALYNFATKPENQEAFGIYPFDNKDVIIGGATEKGGHFQDVYKEFSDEYTLNKGLLNGWVYENGGYAYYEDGVKYTGIRKVGQFYYDFGSTGINIGQTKYSGMFQIEGVNYYAQNGLLTGGWFIDKNENKYYFDENGKAVDGEITLDEVKLIFDNGLLVGGFTGFLKKSNGNTHYFQNGNMVYGWMELDGKWYCFGGDGIMNVGDGTAATKKYPTEEASRKNAYYIFNEQGHALYVFPNDYGYYYWADLPARNQWIRNGYDLDGWYHTNETGHYVTTLNEDETFQLTLGDKTYTAVKIEFDGVVYTFDNSNGKLLLGDKVYKNDQWFYYWAGKPVNDGWFQFKGDTYYAYSDGHLATGSATIDGESYMFTPQGVLITEGVLVKAVLSEGNKNLNVNILNVNEEVTEVSMAIWARKAGQGATLQWIDMEKQDDGRWMTNVELCKVQLTEADTFEIHVYGKVNADGEEFFIVNSSVEVNPAAEHSYSDALDTSCNVCGFIREIKPDDSEQIPTTPMYRLYNPNSGEHFYTGSGEERDMLVTAGWIYEGIAWNAPIKNGAPVFRVFNPNSGDHHYTMSQEEVDMLVELGWKYEGVAWNSASSSNIPQYRLYNPNADVGSHHYTSSTEERDMLVGLGWKLEGIGWYGMLK